MPRSTPPRGYGNAALTWLRREAMYAGWAARAIARPLVLVVVAAIGAVVEHEYGHAPGEPPPSWSYAFFVSYCLLFLEHLESTPEHPLAQLMHYLQPLIGVILVSEGILRLGLDLMNKQANARVWVGIMASTTSGHVIVCGLGSVGFRIVEELRAMKVEVFAIERDAAGPFVDRARQLGVEVVIGDGRSENLLRDLHPERARAVILATDDDLANMEIAMDLRELTPDVPIVMRLFDQRLAQKVKATLGVQVSVSTSRLAAPLFASAALHPSVVGAHRVGDTVLVVVQVTVNPASSLRGRTVATLGALGLTVVSIRGGGGSWEVQPAADRMVSGGDQLQLLVASERVDEVQALALG
ncbi:MAG: NAD(P)-binding protein [Myxococcota bacterium]